jgi:hypothetical protein
MPKSFGYIDPEQAQNDPLTAEHVKLRKSTRDIISFRGEKEARHRGWVMRDWLEHAAEAYIAEHKAEFEARQKSRAIAQRTKKRKAA